MFSNLPVWFKFQINFLLILYISQIFSSNYISANTRFLLLTQDLTVTLLDDGVLVEKTRKETREYIERV